MPPRRALEHSDQGDDKRRKEQHLTSGYDQKYSERHQHNAAQ
jgi:hypothetical protein